MLEYLAKGLTSALGQRLGLLQNWIGNRQGGAHDAHHSASHASNMGCDRWRKSKLICEEIGSTRRVATSQQGEAVWSCDRSVCLRKADRSAIHSTALASVHIRRHSAYSWPVTGAWLLEGGKVGCWRPRQPLTSCRIAWPAWLATSPVSGAKNSPNDAASRAQASAHSVPMRTSATPLRPPSSSMTVDRSKPERSVREFIESPRSAFT